MFNITEVSFDQWIMVVLTAIIAISVVVQAWCTSAQASIAGKAEERAVSRNQPKVKITPYCYSFGEISKDQHIEKHFDGFTVVNAGFVPVTITNFNLETGVPVGAGSVSIPIVTPVDSYKDKTLTTMALPHRLEHSESFQVLYDEDDLIQKFGMKRVRPICHDSLHNSYTTDFWLLWEKNKTSFHDDPGHDLVAASERNMRKQ